MPCVLDDVYKLPVELWLPFFSLSGKAWHEYLTNCSGDLARQKVVAEKLQDDYWEIFVTMFDYSKYIEPGEYRYCQQGWHLLYDHNGPCFVCSKLLGVQPDSPEFKVWAEKRAEQVIEHDMLVEERMALALKRFRQGLPPVYWMKK